MPDTTTGKVIECLAAVAWRPKQPLSMETIQVDPPKAHEIRIKIISTGMCSTDINSLNDGGIKANFPCILGHEGAGIVESVGEGVTDFTTGDHVIPLYVPQCNECKFCKSSETNLCLAIISPAYGSGLMRDGTSRFTCKGKKIFHFCYCSTFSEYTVIPEIALTKINKKAPLNRVCLLGCGVSTGYGAAINTANVKPGTSCAIWGLGSVGLACVLGCKHAGASRIIGIDINPNKFELAKKFGVTECLNPNDYEKPIQQVLAEMSSFGLDYTFECIGNVETMRAALESTVWGWGTTIIIGVAPADARIDINPMHFMTGHKCSGSIFGNWKGKTDLPKLVDRYVNSELNLDDFVTHDLPLEKINESIEMMKEGKCIRCILNC